MVPGLEAPLVLTTTAAPPVVRLLPAASLACRVSVTVPPDMIVPLDTDTTEVVAEAAPAVTVICGRTVLTGVALIVAPIVVGVPDRIPVNVAVYVPSPLSVAGLGAIDPVLMPPPLELVNATVAPPVVIRLPAASFACSVSVLVPPERIDPLETDTTDAAAEIGPGFTVIDGAAVLTGVAPIVAWIAVAEPAVTPVKIAVYVPSPLSVVEPIVPVLVPPRRENATIAPPVERMFPAASFACSVSVLVAPERMLPLDTVTVEVTAEIRPGVTVTVGSAVLTGVALIVAPIFVAVPATRPVNVAVYVPLALSVVLLIVPVLVPPLFVNATVAPPAVSALPAASWPVSGSVTPAPDVTDPLDTDTSDVAAEMAPGITATVGSAVPTGVALIVA